MKQFPPILQKRVPARALFYALVIALLMAMMSSLLISLATLQRQQQTDQIEKERHLTNINSGIALLRAAPDEQLSSQIELYPNDPQPFRISKKDWGMYSLGTVISTTTSRQDSLIRTCYLGHPAPNSLLPALYLCDQKEALVLAGKTTIQGSAFLPKSKARTALIEGQPFQGRPLQPQQQQRSSGRLPDFNTAKVKRLQQYFHWSTPSEELPLRLWQSFTDTTAIFFHNTLYLSSQELQGNIILIARDSIIVGSDSQLGDVLLFAPKIVFRSGFKGQVQAFASRQLIVEEGSEFRYPSVLGGLKRKEQHCLLDIQRGSRLSGLVFLWEETFSRQSGGIRIATDARIEGQVFCAGWVELQGQVNGNLSCRKFELSTPSAVYSNHLLNASINRNSLPNSFASPMVEEPVRAAVVKWINENHGIR